MNQFSIEIPNPRTDTYRIMTNLLLIIISLAFGAILLGKAVGSNQAIVALCGVLLNAIAAGVRMLKKNLLIQLRPGPWLIFLVDSIIWIVIGKLFIAFLIGFFSIAGIYAARRLYIGFTEEGIAYPSFPSRIIYWSSVEQVICKDGILTIDLKNNKLLQFNISPASAHNLNEVDFNSYCKRQCG